MPHHPRSLTNRHHILPRSRGGEDVNGNVLEIDRRAHAILHDVFSNLTPREYLNCFATRATTDYMLGKLVLALIRHWGERNIRAILDAETI